MKARVGGLMAAALVLAQFLQAAPLRECPHHDHGALGSAATVHAPTAPAATPSTAAELADPTDHSERADHATGPEHEDPSHDGPCDCLGDCQAPPVVQSPVRPAGVAPVPNTPRQTAEAPPVEAGAFLAVVPFALPFCRPPPA